MPFQDHPLPADFSVVPIIQRSKPLPPRKKKGAVARITRDLKQGIIEAAENIGSDGNGEGGLVGFLEDLGRHHKKAFAGLLGKVLPMQPSASTGVSPVAINIIGVPSGHYLSEEDIAKVRGKTLQIEHYEPEIEYESQPAPRGVRSTPAEDEAETKIIEKLKREINELAQQKGVDVEL